MTHNIGHFQIQSLSRPQNQTQPDESQMTSSDYFKPQSLLAAIYPIQIFTHVNLRKISNFKNFRIFLWCRDELESGFWILWFRIAQYPRLHQMLTC